MGWDATPRRAPRVRGAAILLGVLLATVLGILITAAWLAQREQQDGHAALAGTTVDASTLPQTVPFTTVAGHLVVAVMLAGSSDPIPLMLDSGAPVMLSDELADRSGGARVGSTKTAAVDGSVRNSDVVRIPEVRIGDAVFRDVGAVKGFIGPDNPLSCLSPNGLLGASLLKEAVWQIDYGKGTVTIAESVAGLDHVQDAIRLAFEGASGASPSPLIVIDAGGGSFRVLLDTGSDGGLSANPADLERIGIKVPADGPAYDVLATGVAGTYETRVLYASTDLALPDLYLDDYPVATLDSLQPGQGNLGNAFLDDFVVTIDWPSKVVYLDPRSDAPRPPLPPAATFGWDGERIIVASVVAGSDPARAGLSVGQPIRAMDGRDVSTATRDDFCELLTAGARSSFVITTDDGTTHQIGPVTGFFDSPK